MPRLLYTLLLYLLLPFIPLKLLWRGMRQREYLRHWPERFGIYGERRETYTQKTIWLHCVSVGETRAAAPLVTILQKRFPDYRILLTHATPTGRAAGEQLFGDAVQRVYLPYDVPGAVSRFLKHFEPTLGLLMETELWFNLIAACRQRNLPLLLVNARLSQRSAQGYARIRRLTAQGLQNLTAIAAQTADDAARLQGLGAHNVAVLGNLKFDVKPSDDAWQQGAKLRAHWQKDRPVFLAASTREGEEALILGAVAKAQIPNLLTVIVPRHPQRFDEVADLLNKRGLAFVRRSSLPAARQASEHADQTVASASISQQTPVMLGDSMGEMFTYYAACDVAFIGGSLLPLGGQNLLEACAVGKPVLIGPHTFNFAEVSEQAIAANAALRVQDSSALAAALKQLLSDSALRENMGRAGLSFSTGAIGATQRVADLVSGYLEHTHRPGEA